MTNYIYYFFAFMSWLTRIRFFIKAAHKYKKLVLEKRGVSIGERSVIYGTTFSSSFEGDKFFIGCDCTITGVSFIGHDAAPTLFIEELQMHKDVCLPGARKSVVSPIYVGDRVFIGHGSIILPGSIIESDTIVGAGSIVRGRLLSGNVYAGNPAKKVMTLETYLAKYHNNTKTQDVQ